MIRNKELFRNRLFPIGGREASPPARVGFAAGPDPSDDTRIPIALFCRISGQGTSTRNLETLLVRCTLAFSFCVHRSRPERQVWKGQTGYRSGKGADDPGIWSNLARIADAGSDRRRLAEAPQPVDLEAGLAPLRSPRRPEHRCAALFASTFLALHGSTECQQGK